MSISLCMIAKNEEQDLPLAIETAKNFVEEIVVVDTGSTDNTVAVAEAAGAKVLHYNHETNPEGFLFDEETQQHFLANFAAARNLGYEAATKNFTLCLDTDEEVQNAEKLRDAVKLMEGQKLNQLAMPIDWAFDEQGRCIGTMYHYRLTRRGTKKWVGAVHETLVPVDSVTIKFDSIRIRQRQRKKDSKATATRVKHRNYKILRHEVEKGNRDPRIFFYVAREASWVPSLDEAKKYYWEYLKVATWVPERQLARLELGKLYEDQQDYKTAAKLYVEATQEPEPLPEAWFACARVAYFQEQWALCVAATQHGFGVGNPQGILFHNPFDRNHNPHMYYNVALAKLGQMRAALKSCLDGLFVRENWYLRQNAELYRDMGVEI